MNIITIIAVISIFLVGTFLVINHMPKNKFPEKDLSIIYIKPNEKSEIRTLRDNGYNGIISIPEEDLVNSKTESLYYQADLIKSIYNIE